MTRRELLLHLAAEAILAKTLLVNASLPGDGHAFLGKGNAVCARGNHAIDVDLHLGVVHPLVVVISNDGRVARVEGEERDFLGVGGIAAMAEAARVFFMFAAVGVFLVTAAAADMSPGAALREFLDGSLGASLGSSLSSSCVAMSLSLLSVVVDERGGNWGGG